MISVVLYLLLILLVMNHSIVLRGAKDGLMLWYNNILPILLPFMMISSYIVLNSKKNNKANHNETYYCALCILLGTFCGYPIGAKCINEYVQDHKISKKAGNSLLPLCNNVSPMFLCGYVKHYILKDQISFVLILFLIYFPYIMYTLLSLTLNHKKEKNIIHTSENTPNEASIMLSCIQQITCVGVYIMFASIIIEFINIIPYLSINFKLLLSATTELTNGINDLALSDCFSGTKKTALVIAFTSFGGLSSAMQTKMVANHKELSMFNYIIVKTICSICTYYLTLLLI